jgi:hypothetical protein
MLVWRSEMSQMALVLMQIQSERALQDVYTGIKLRAAHTIVRSGVDLLDAVMRSVS